MCGFWYNIGEVMAVFKLFEFFKKEKRTKKEEYLKLFDYYKETYKLETKYVENFSIFCVYTIPYEFYFGMNVDGKISYFTMFEWGETLTTLWAFLVSIVKYGYGECFYDIEGYLSPVLYAVSYDEKHIRVIYSAPNCFDEIEHKDGSYFDVIEYPDWVHFDIIIDKKKFIYEFYKELFTIYHKKGIPSYDIEPYNDSIFEDEPFLRGYFGDLTDAVIFGSVNPKTKEIHEK